MSPLTKVFVVLLVIVSLLQTAGTVVFVNKIDPMQKTLAAANLGLATAKSQANAEHQAAMDAQHNTDLIRADEVAQKKASDDKIAGLQAEKSALTVQIAQLTAEKTKLTTDAEKQTQDLNWVVSAYTKSQEDVKKLRDNNDGLIKRQEDDSRSIATLTNLSDTVTAQYNNAREQLQLDQNNIEKYCQLIKTLGHDPNEALATGFVPGGPGTPPINGHVQETKVQNGATYVTISVGSADNVLKGMRFNVLDTHGNFLCFADIESVDSNVAIGKLDGQPDKINQVQVGDDVKTQIRGS